MTEKNLEQALLQHTDLLHRISVSLLRNRQDREDAVQNALETAWRKAGSIREPERLKAWLARVMINSCYTLLRKKQWEVPVEALLESREDITPDALALHFALEKLPDGQRLPLILHYFEGFSIKETAIALRLPQGTVLSRMQRGREKLRQLLSEEYDG